MQHETRTLTQAVRRALYGAGVGAAALGLAACGGGGSSSGDGSLSLDVTDAPVDSAESVVVTFDGLTLNPSDGEKVEISFDQSKTIDLLSLTGDASESLLEDETVPAGGYDWIELDVDADPDGSTDDSSITIDGQTHELVLPTQQGNSQSGRGLRLVSGFDVPVNGSADFTIDFNLRKAITDPQGKEEYFLRPALRLVDNTQVGHIDATATDSYVTNNSCGSVADQQAVYVFEGADAELDDIDGQDPEPVTTAPLTNEDKDATYEATAGFLEAGTYTVTFVCDSEDDMAPTQESTNDDSLTYNSTTNVEVKADDRASYDLPLQNGGS